MTYTPPQHVLDNAAKRLAAGKRRDLCTLDGCHELGRHSAAGRPGQWCPEHFAAFGITVPTPDPTRTVAGLRAAQIARADERRETTAETDRQEA